MNTNVSHTLAAQLMNRMKEIQYKELPQFKHDCNQCTFLGRFSSDVDYDLYYCPQGRIPTVIARYSNHGPDCMSGLGFTLTPLKEAERRAHNLNLL